MSKRLFGTVRHLRSGKWQARYRGAGGMVTAPHTFTTKADASRYLAVVETDMARGIFIDPRAGRVTLTEWVDDWLRGNPAKRATTRARDESVLRTHFLPSLGDRPLASLTPLDVRRVVDSMTAKVAPVTARTNLGVLAAVLNAAVEADLIARSPVRGVKLATAPPRARPTLTPEELGRLAEAVAGRYRALILAAGVCALRWSELVGLRVGDIDFLGRRVTVTQTISEVSGRHMVADPKSRTSTRTLSLPVFLVEELARHLRDFRPGASPSDLVFTGPKGGTLRRSFASRVFKPAVSRAGLSRDLTFHGLRHAATALMVEHGEHPRVIQHRLGHANGGDCRWSSTPMFPRPLTGPRRSTSMPGSPEGVARAPKTAAGAGLLWVNPLSSVSASTRGFAGIHSRPITGRPCGVVGKNRSGTVP